jgi:hypothetical protein
LDVHAGAVQAILALILTVVTACYAWLTRSLLEQAEASADAARRSADAAEKTISFMRQQYEEQISLAPVAVAHTILTISEAIRYWKSEAARHSTDANPADLAQRDAELAQAVDLARPLSPDCASFLVQVRTSLQAAQHEIEKMQATTLDQHKRAYGTKAVELMTTAGQRLDLAYSALTRDVPKIKLTPAGPSG